MNNLDASVAAITWFFFPALILIFLTDAGSRLIAAMLSMGQAIWIFIFLLLITSIILMYYVFYYHV
jgi:hypothetical protein